MRNLYRCWVQMMVLDLVVRTRRWDLQPSSRSPTRSMTSARQRVKRRPGYVVSRTVHKEYFFPVCRPAPRNQPRRLRWWQHILARPGDSPRPTPRQLPGSIKDACFTKGNPALRPWKEMRLRCCCHCQSNSGSGGSASKPNEHSVALEPL